MTVENSITKHWLVVFSDGNANRIFVIFYILIKITNDRNSITIFIGNCQQKHFYHYLYQKVPT